MRDTVIILRLDKYDYGLIFHLLNEKRNELIKDHLDTETVDNVLLKVIEAGEKRKEGWSMNDKHRNF